MPARRIPQRSTLLAPCALLACLLSAPVAAQVPRVLIVGDSWAAQQWADDSHALVFAAHGHLDIGTAGASTTESGSTAAEWAQPAYLARIANALNAQPSLDIVQLTIGGNDFLDAWNTALPPAQVEALREAIRVDLATVTDFVLAQRPDIEVVLSFYDYPNFVDTLNSLAGIAVCRPLHEDLGQPTPLQINTAATEFEQAYAALAAHPRVYFVGHAGHMQHAFGFPGTPPGTLLPPGDLSRPSPVAAMRDHGFLGRDCFHLTPDGYDVLVENLYEGYFAERFDTVFRTPFE